MDEIYDNLFVKLQSLDDREKFLVALGSVKKCLIDEIDLAPEEETEFLEPKSRRVASKRVRK
jgi:hypothetical protein